MSDPGGGLSLAFRPHEMGAIHQKLVGTCARCELHIAVDLDKRNCLELLLLHHEASCQGGDRFDHVWMPYAIAEYPVVELETTSEHP